MELPKTFSNYLSEMVQRNGCFSQLTDYSIKTIKDTFESYACNIQNMFKKCTGDYLAESDMFSSCIQSTLLDKISLKCVSTTSIVINNDEETIGLYSDIIRTYFKLVDDDLLTQQLIDMNPSIKYVCNSIKGNDKLTKFIVQIECTINSIKDVDFLTLKIYETINQMRKR